MTKIHCELCSNKKCREGVDCYNIKQDCIVEYSEEETSTMAKSASKLIDNGRAGTLSRLQEIIEYCKLNNYNTIGIAHCIAFDKLAKELALKLRGKGFEPVPVICTAGGVKEHEIDQAKTAPTVSCNPIGQAILLNNSSVDIIIEIGLCMGHDLLFHKHIEIPVTVLIVKDRVNNHNPALDFKEYRDANMIFLETMDNSFGMKSPDWLKDMIKQSDNLIIIDLRIKKKYEESHIPGAINILLKELPSNYRELLPDKNSTVVVYCNGSVQSAYAIMFLNSRGYLDVHNLSGGWSRWEKEM